MPHDVLGPSQQDENLHPAHPTCLPHETPHSDRESVEIPMDMSPAPLSPSAVTITSAVFSMVLHIVPPTAREGK